MQMLCRMILLHAATPPDVDLEESRWTQMKHASTDFVSSPLVLQRFDAHFWRPARSELATCRLIWNSISDADLYFHRLWGVRA